MLNMYKEILKFTTVAVESKYRAISTSAGKTILEAIGAAAPATPMTNVKVHYVIRE